MKKVIRFKPSMRIIENCRHCMYSHYEYKNKLFSLMKTDYFCLCLGTGPVDALKKAKIPVYQGDNKYGIDKLEDMSYVYIENPDNILPECPLENYIE